MSFARFYAVPMALRIKQLRTVNGWTQEVLAAKAGLSRSQLSEIETEAKPANTRRLTAIAQALSVDVSELFDGGAREAYRYEIDSIMTELPDEDRDALMRIARAMRGRAPASNGAPN
jgi:transcriptional regulator with XRE-family HTH domain